jgi:hypothetical protein
MKAYATAPPMTGIALSIFDKFSAITDVLGAAGGL